MKAANIYLFLAIGLLFSCQTPTVDQDTVYLRLGADIQRINPLLSGDAYSRQVEALIYQPLFQFDLEGKKMVPVLAEGEPQRSKDQQRPSYTFKIKEAAKWADGKEVTGYDVQFTFRQIFNPHLPTQGFRAYLHFLDKILVNPLDSKEYTVFTNAPYFLAETVLSNIEIFPAHHHDPKGVLKDHSIMQLKELSAESCPPAFQLLADDFERCAREGKLLGSGPYALASWTRGENILLQRSENYWAANELPVDLMQGQSEWIDFRIIPDAQSAWQSFQAKELDVFNEVPDEFYRMACVDASAAQCLAPPQPLYYYIGLNRSHAALSSPKLRQAVAQCLDIDRWIAQNLEGLAVRIDNPISPQKSYSITAKHPRFAIEEAIKSFEAAGWMDSDGEGIREQTVNGKPQRLQLRYAYVAANAQGKQLGIFFKGLAAKAGLEILLQPLDFQALRNNLRSGDFDMYYLANYDPPTDLDPRSRWHTEARQSGNYVGFGNAASDQLIEQIGITLSAAKRAEYYKQFQQMILEDQPCIFLFSPRQKIIAAEDISLTASHQWPGYRAQSVRRKP